MLAGLAVATKDLLEGIGSLALRIIEDVGVDVLGGLDVGVAQHVHRDAWWNALRCKQACTRVPEIVKANIWQTGTLEDRFEGAHQVARAHRRPDAGGKDETMFLPPRSLPQSLFELPDTMCLEIGDQHR